MADFSAVNLFGKLTQNCDDILERLVILQDLLYTTSNLVVFLTNNIRVHNTGGGVKRIDSGVDTQLSNGAGQYSGGVQVSKGGSGGGIGQIVSGYINSLY